jgi:hypothetical protein
MPYSPEAESAAFRRVHTLAQAIAQLRAQGNAYGVEQLLPYFRQAIEAYRAVGAADPDMLTKWDQVLLNANEFVRSGAKAVGQVVTGTLDRMVVLAALALGLFVLFSRAR